MARRGAGATERGWNHHGLRRDAPRLDARQGGGHPRQGGPGARQEGTRSSAGVRNVYGLPLVLMDLTREALTAAARSGEYSAPINQFHRLRDFVHPDFKNVVRISRNSLWCTAWSTSATSRCAHVPDPRAAATWSSR